MQVTRATFIPLLAPGNSDRIDPGAVVDNYCSDLNVIYTFGPQFGRRVVTHADLDQMQLPLPVLRRSAYEHLEVLSSRAEFHGQPPALMLSFEGLESSLVLANDFWTRLEGAVPGELVVGVPARDVVIVTGSQSGAGMEKVRRCVERVFFAGGDFPLSRNLLVRRSGVWEPFDRPARQGHGRPGFGPSHQLGLGQPPRQYQEHPSWPEEQMRPVSGPVGHRRGRPPMHQPMHPAAAHMGPGRPPMPQGGRPGPMTGFTPPVHTGFTPAVHTGFTPPVHTGFTPAVHTGFTPPVAGGYGPPAHRPAHQNGQQPPISHRAPSVPDIAQYSAMPYSAVPHSAVPYSGPPVSGSSYVPSPQLRGAPAHDRLAPEARYEDGYDQRSYGDAKPAYGDGGGYHDDSSSTGTQPRYADYSSVGDAEQSRPEYPGTWNRLPEQSASRPEWRSSPRARFSSR